MRIPQPNIPAIAFEAICKNLDAPISNLEWLGVPVRVLHQLDEHGQGITTLRELLSKEPCELLNIGSFGTVSLRQIYAALAMYHELEERQQAQIDPRMQSRIAVLET